MNISILLPFKKHSKKCTLKYEHSLHLDTADLTSLSLYPTIKDAHQA